MDDLMRLEQKIGYRFRNKQLLYEALTHTSYSNEVRFDKAKYKKASPEGNRNNERMEFLGDSVLNLIITNHLYDMGEKHSEGELSRIRSTIVCEKSLRMTADTFGLSAFLFLGKGEERTGGRTRDSIIADAMEALIGAVYLDSGFESAKEFVIKHMLFIIKDAMQGKLFKDYKTQYQELVQKAGEKRIEYQVINEEGPDHNKRFTVSLFLDGEHISVGNGRSKKEAEQNAAKEAIAIGTFE